MTDLRATIGEALQLCNWIAETPSQRGSINGKAAQVGYALEKALSSLDAPKVELSDAEIDKLQEAFTLHRTVERSWYGEDYTESVNDAWGARKFARAIIAAINAKGVEMKRLRKPKMKNGELRMYWGRPDPHDNPDVVLAWQGDRRMKADTALLHYHLCSKRPDPRARPLFSVMEPSLIEDLEARGYDLTTLKFSIMKKVTQP
jgi:hypothetical protein